MQLSYIMPGRVVRAALFYAMLLPATAGAACQLQSFEIPVTMKNMRAVAHVRVNETQVPLTLDSGAFFSTLTDAAVAQLNLKTRWANLRAWGITGSVDFHVTRVERLGIEKDELKNIEFLVGGNEPGAGTMGVLGRNILLSMGDTEYDLAHGMVRLMKPNSDCKRANLAYWAKPEQVFEVPLIARRDDKVPAIKAEVKINGKKVTAVLDTGARTLLSLNAAKRIGLIADESRMQPAGKVFGFGRGERQSWMVPVESVELGSERIAANRLQVADMVDTDDSDMLIGIDFFLAHRIYVALSQDKIFFTSNGGPAFEVTTVAAEGSAANDAPAPQDAAFLARRGAAFAARNEPARALADFNRAIELAPTVADYRVQRAHVKLALQQRDAALADLEEALRLDPNADEARLDRAWLKISDGAADIVKTDLEVLDKRVAPQSDMRRRMGELFLALKEPLSAVRQYDHWIKAHPRQVDLHAALNSRCWARALANTELDKALDDCDKALDAKPKIPAYLDSRGMVYLRLQQWDKAIADYDAALALRPKLVWSLWGRGLANLGAGNTDQGLIDVAAAKALSPGIEAEAHRYGLDIPAALLAARKP